MAEGGEEYYSSSDDDSDVSLFDLDEDDDDADCVDREDAVQPDDDGEQAIDEEKFQKQHDAELFKEIAEQDEPQEDVAKNDENHDKPRLNVSMYLRYVSGYFYERNVTPL